MQTDDADVFLTSTLLGLDKTRRTVDADDQASCDLGIEGSAMSGLFDAQHALDPCDDFVGGRVGGLVEVDHAGTDIALEVAFQGGGSMRYRCEVAGSDEYYRINVSKKLEARQAVDARASIRFE